MGPVEQTLVGLTLSDRRWPLIATNCGPTVARRASDVRFLINRFPTLQTEPLTPCLQSGGAASLIVIHGWPAANSRIRNRQIARFLLQFPAASWLRALNYHRPDPCHGRRDAERLLDQLPGCPIPELARLGRTLRAWHSEFLAYFDTGGVNNGPTEAINLLVEKIRRVGHCYPQLRQLPATAAAALRSDMADSGHATNPEPLSTFGGVEPVSDVDN